MIRNLVLLFNMIALLVYQAIFTEGVTINQTVPATAKAGSEFTVELKITKGSVGGFAKLQQDLPVGFTATAVENSGGSFTFTNQSIKIIWASLPSQSEFKVTYKITVDNTMKGPQAIAGKFSYVDAANQKQSIGIDAATIDITADEPVEIVKKEETKTDTTTKGSTTGTENNKQTTTGTTDIKKEEESTALPVQTITATRSLPSEATGEFTVEITLNKGNIAGYCKLQETLPAGFTAKVVDRGNSEFTFVNQVAKFVWVSISPKTEQLKVSYKVSVDLCVSGSQSIEGLFSYIENDATKKYTLAVNSVNIKAEETIAANNKNENTTLVKNLGDTTNKTTTLVKNTTDTSTTGQTNTNTANTNTQNNTNTTGQNNTNTTANTTTTNNTTTTGQENTTANNDNKTNPVTIVPSAQTTVNYRVQISATHKNVDVSYFQGKYSIGEQIYAEMHEGWNKFTVGGFNEYKLARDHREDIRNKGVVGPFVTAYNSGKRITVQEALMVSSQKWYR